MAVQPDVSKDISIATLRDAFAGIDRFTILGRGPSAIDERGRALPVDAVLQVGATYATRDVFAGEPVGVLIGTPPDMVGAIARRFHDTPVRRRPVLMYTFLVAVPAYDFQQFDLHPIPIGPLLRDAGFTDFDAAIFPTSGVFLTTIAAALGKAADVAGIDLYQHASGRVYVEDAQTNATFAWPKYHSLDCDLRHIRQAAHRLQGKLNLSPDLRKAIQLNPALG